MESFYSQFDSFTEMIREFGKPVYIGVLDRSQDYSIPSNFRYGDQEWTIDQKFIDSPAYAVQVAHRMEDRSNPEILTSDIMLLIQSGVRIAVGDKLSFSTQNTFRVVNSGTTDGPVAGSPSTFLEFEVVSVEVVRPAHTTLLYRVAIRR